jgi:amidase
MKVTASTELWNKGASQLAAEIRERRASSREVVEAHLTRIEAVNPRVNAVTTVLAEEALRAADQADEKLALGDPVGPLHGVPFSVKENIDVAGSATSQGVVAMAGAIAPVDAPQVASIRRAGAIPVARTNMPDFALRLHTDNALHGATRNPWDATRTPGGSSGGEAVALATGMTPLGLGTDLGGSLRYPSQCNGTVAIRPSLGRVPRARSLEPVDAPISIQVLNSEGPMARHIADLRLALEVMSSSDWRDPWYVPVPLEGPPISKPARVALVVDPEGMGVSAQVAAGVRRAGDHLAAAGYEVEEKQPPGIMEAADVWARLLAADVRVMWPTLAPVVSEGARRVLELAFELWPEADHASYMQAFMTRQRLARAWAEFLLDHPLLVAPISTEPPFPVGADLTLDGSAGLISSLRMTLAVNALGLPAVAVPTGVAEGLPQAVQVIGPRYREDLCLDTAEALERASGVFTPIEPPE